MTFEIPREAQNIVESLTIGMIEVVLDEVRSAFNDGEWHHLTSDDFESELDKVEWNDANAIGLSLEDQLRTLERSDFAEDVNPELTLETLRREIEGACSTVLHYEAMHRVREAFTEFCDWRDDHDLTELPWTEENPYGWAVHEQERYPDGVTTVYEYRNVEGLDVDVWNFRQQFLEVFVSVVLESEDED